MELRDGVETEIHPPLLEIQVAPDCRVSFFSFNSFYPSFKERSLRVHNEPTVTKSVLSLTRRDSRSDMTYKNTVQEEGWQRPLYRFIKSYLEGEGQHIMDKLGIREVHNLTPHQAVGLVAGLMVDLTKYKMSNIGKNLTESDRSTTLQLLEEGLANKNNPDWEGNGVCRNFASVGKAVFEALRDYGDPNSHLSNMYVRYESGDEYAPGFGGKLNRFGYRDLHAWDTFLAVTEVGNIEATVVDFTWASRSSGGEVVNLDYTQDRIESFVFEMARILQGSPEEIRSGRQEIFRFYLDSIRKNIKTSSQYFAQRALQLISDTESYDEVLPDLGQELWRSFSEISSDTDIGDVKRLWTLAQRRSTKEDMVHFLKVYAKEIKLNDYLISNVVVDDDGLQRLIVEQIRSRKEFPTFLKESPQFRVRVRELDLPGILPPFSPLERKEDFTELRFLRNRSLKGTGNAIFDYGAEVTAERLASFYQQVRKILANLNREKYWQEVAIMTDYDIVKNFDLLRNKLSS